MEVFSESFVNNALPPSLTQGLITWIPKHKKDLVLLDNWRPICLLNNDDKISASIFAERMKTVLDSIIEETQSGFMRNGHISKNIRLVLDLIDYSDLIWEDSWIVFLDFNKAFDSMEHFYFSPLRNLVLGNYFVVQLKLFIWMGAVQLN